MMGRQRRDQGKLFYEFRLDDRIPQIIYCDGSMCLCRLRWPTFTRN